MKKLSELRNQIDFFPTELSSRLKYLIRQNIDFNVYLQSKARNLQRELCWSLSQRRELINSMLIGRHIPHLAIVNIINPSNESDEILQIIDGKQRLSTMIDFYTNLFSIEIEGSEYYFKDLPKEYQMAISHFEIRYYLVNEPYGKPMTDDQKINWFKFINFAGTPQEKEYLESFNN